MEIAEELNKDILEVWKNNSKKRGNFYPILYPDLRAGKVLFIGMNPSFSEDKFEQIIKKNPAWEKLNSIEEFFKYPEADKKRIINFEKRARENHSYFTIFNKCDFEWEHIDLFFYRNTSQEKFKNDIIELKFNKEGKIKKINEFGELQLNLSISTISKLKPKIIVVINADASRILREKMEIDNSKFKEEGFDRLKNNRTPIFFSGMLTGQHALDKGSLERLFWQIKNCNL
jgi:hypothetical protein